MRYGKIMESTGRSVRDLNLPPVFWESDDVRLVNQNLVSLDGCSDEILGYFSCWGNNLTSLAGGPQIVGGFFDCMDSQLTSLEHAPKMVGEYFACGNNYLTSLADIHKNIHQMNGTLHIGGNPITSHILGVLLIRGCTEVSDFSSVMTSKPEFKQAVEILNRYLGKGRAGIMDCQAEMIAADLGDFAQI